MPVVQFCLILRTIPGCLTQTKNRDYRLGSCKSNLRVLWLCFVPVKLLVHVLNLRGVAVRRGRDTAIQTACANRTARTSSRNGEQYFPIYERTLLHKLMRNSGVLVYN